MSAETAMHTDPDWDSVAEVGGDLGACVWQASAKFLELGALAPGKTVVDLATGAGGLAHEAAELVRGAGGRVIGVDTAPRMIQLAQDRAGQREDLSYRVHDAEEPVLPDGSCDVAFCRFALPLFADPKRAAARARAVLKPGGRFAVMGIGGSEHNEFFTLLGDFVGAPLQRTLMLGEVGPLGDLLAEADFESVKTRSIRALITVGDPSAYWNAVRGAFGIPDPAIPPALAGLVPPGQRLSLELVLALATKRDANAKAQQVVRGMDEMVAAARRHIRELTPHEVKRKLKGEQVVYLDVREPEERSARIKNAISVPRGELEAKVPLLVPDPKALILVHCERGRHSALAARQLQDLGYVNVWSLYGGVEAWLADGMPVERV